MLSTVRAFLLLQKSIVSQPTISTHIKQLEAELGVQLLVKINKRCDIVRRGSSVLSICSQASGDGK